MSSEVYLPAAFRSFQGFDCKDIKEFRKERRIELHLAPRSEGQRLCHRCGVVLGEYKDRHYLRVKHLRMMNWLVELIVPREKRYCSGCKKTRSQEIGFLCPTSPHMTLELAWWINRLTEISTVYEVSRLEGLDKETCYRLDKYILTRLLQGYRIPKVTSIAVDEVYARSPRQLREGENRNDLFMTIVTDLKTHKVIWVSQGRERDALDEFFTLLGAEAAAQIEVVAADQHSDYAASVKDHCPKAKLVWDRFHLVQKLNEALNEDRKDEYERLKKNKDEAQKYLMGGNRFRFLTKASHRSQADKRFIDQVCKENEKLLRLEIIKEHFHKVFEAPDEKEAEALMRECISWAKQAGARWSYKALRQLWNSITFWNYFAIRVTTGVSEGINRAIKTLKWKAYGYKDMAYFALKILQKLGYLNSRYHFMKF